MTEQRQIDKPMPGYWMIRLAKGAPEVPACIEYEQTTHEPGNPENVMERSAVLTARIRGEVVPIDRVWLRRGRTITKAEHDFQVADARWAERHAPAEPKANPDKPIDLNKLKPVF